MPTVDSPWLIALILFIGLLFLGFGTWSGVRWLQNTITERYERTSRDTEYQSAAAHDEETGNEPAADEGENGNTETNSRNDSAHSQSSSERSNQVFITLATSISALAAFMTMVLTGGLVVGTFLLWITSDSQSVTQSRQFKDQLAAANKSANAAKTAADAATIASNAASEQATTMSDTLEHMKATSVTQAKQFKNQLAVATQSAQAAKIAADAAAKNVEALQKTERAWLSYYRLNTIEFQNSTGPDGLPKDGFALSFDIANTGRTAAIKAAIRPKVEVVCAESRQGLTQRFIFNNLPTFDVPEVDEVSRAAIITTTTESGTDMHPFFGDEAKNIVNGKCVVYAYLYVIYRDIFSETDRETEICMSITFNGRRQNPDGSFSPNATVKHIGPQNRQT